MFCFTVLYYVYFKSTVRHSTICSSVASASFSAQLCVYAYCNHNSPVLKQKPSTCPESATTLQRVKLYSWRSYPTQYKHTHTHTHTHTHKHTKSTVLKQKTQWKRITTPTGGALMEHNVCRIISPLSSYTRPIELRFWMATKQQGHHAHPIR
jgi:hypothetical protein